MKSMKKPLWIVLVWTCVVRCAELHPEVTENVTSSEVNNTEKYSTSSLSLTEVTNIISESTESTKVERYTEGHNIGAKVVGKAVNISEENESVKNYDTFLKLDEEIEEKCTKSSKRRQKTTTEYVNSETTDITSTEKATSTAASTTTATATTTTTATTTKERESNDSKEQVLKTRLQDGLDLVEETKQTSSHGSEKVTREYENTKDGSKPGNNITENVTVSFEIEQTTLKLGLDMISDSPRENNYTRITSSDAVKRVETMETTLFSEPVTEYKIFTESITNTSQPDISNRLYETMDERVEALSSHKKKKGGHRSNHNKNKSSRGVAAKNDRITLVTEVQTTNNKNAAESKGILLKHVPVASKKHKKPEEFAHEKPSEGLYINFNSKSVPNIERINREKQKQEKTRKNLKQHEKEELIESAKSMTETTKKKKKKSKKPQAIVDRAESKDDTIMDAVTDNKRYAVIKGSTSDLKPSRGVKNLAGNTRLEGISTPDESRSIIKGVLNKSSETRTMMMKKEDKTISVNNSNTELEKSAGKSQFKIDFDNINPEKKTDHIGQCSVNYAGKSNTPTSSCTHSENDKPTEKLDNMSQTAKPPTSTTVSTIQQNNATEIMEKAKSDVSNNTETATLKNCNGTDCKNVTDLSKSVKYSTRSENPGEPEGSISLTNDSNRSTEMTETEKGTFMNNTSSHQDDDTNVTNSSKVTTTQKPKTENKDDIGNTLPRRQSDSRIKNQNVTNFNINDTSSNYTPNNNNGTEKTDNIHSSNRSDNSLNKIPGKLNENSTYEINNVSMQATNTSVLSSNDVKINTSKEYSFNNTSISEDSKNSTGPDTDFGKNKVTNNQTRNSTTDCDVKNCTSSLRSDDSKNNVSSDMVNTTKMDETKNISRNCEGTKCNKTVEGKLEIDVEQNKTGTTENLKHIDCVSSECNKTLQQIPHRLTSDGKEQNVTEMIGNENLRSTNNTNCLIGECNVTLKENLKERVVPQNVETVRSTDLNNTFTNDDEFKINSTVKKNDKNTNLKNTSRDDEEIDVGLSNITLNDKKDNKSFPVGTENQTESDMTEKDSKITNTSVIDTGTGQAGIDTATKGNKSNVLTIDSLSGHNATDLTEESSKDIIFSANTTSNTTLKDKRKSEIDTEKYSESNTTALESKSVGSNNTITKTKYSGSNITVEDDKSTSSHQRSPISGESVHSGSNTTVKHIDSSNTSAMITENDYSGSIKTIKDDNSTNLENKSQIMHDSDHNESNTTLKDKNAFAVDKQRHTESNTTVDDNMNTDSNHTSAVINKTKHRGSNLTKGDNNTANMSQIGGKGVRSGSNTTTKEYKTRDVKNKFDVDHVNNTIAKDNKNVVSNHSSRNTTDCVNSQCNMTSAKEQDGKKTDMRNIEENENSTSIPTVTTSKTFSNDTKCNSSECIEISYQRHEMENETNSENKEDCAAGGCNTILKKMEKINGSSTVDTQMSSNLSLQINNLNSSQPINVSTGTEEENDGHRSLAQGKMNSSTDEVFKERFVDANVNNTTFNISESSTIKTENISLEKNSRSETDELKDKEMLENMKKTTAESIVRKTTNRVVSETTTYTLTFSTAAETTTHTVTSSTATETTTNTVTSSTATETTTNKPNESNSTKLPLTIKNSTSDSVKMTSTIRSELQSEKVINNRSRSNKEFPKRIREKKGAAQDDPIESMDVKRSGDDQNTSRMLVEEEENFRRKTWKHFNMFDIADDMEDRIRKRRAINRNSHHGRQKREAVFVDDGTMKKLSTVVEPLTTSSPEVNSEYNLFRWMRKIASTPCHTTETSIRNDQPWYSFLLPSNWKRDQSKNGDIENNTVKKNETESDLGEISSVVSKTSENFNKSNDGSIKNETNTRKGIGLNVSSSLYDQRQDNQDNSLASNFTVDDNEEEIPPLKRGDNGKWTLGHDLTLPVEGPNFYSGLLEVIKDKFVNLNYGRHQTNENRTLSVEESVSVKRNKDKT